MRLKFIWARKELRFIVVGIINTCVGYGAYALCLSIGLYYPVAQLISMFVGIANSYIWNKYYTFQQPKRSVSEFVRFASVYGVCYAINFFSLYLFIEIIHMDEYLAGAVGILFTTIISYTGHSRFSFVQSR